MKQMFNNTRALRIASVLGLTGMLAGMVAVTPAHAQDDWHFHRWNDNAHFDRSAIRRDENRLHDLYNQRRDAKNRHDWRAVKRLDQRISDVRSHLDNDRYVGRR